MGVITAAATRSPNLTPTTMVRCPPTSSALDSADSDVKNLFSAIDTDGDGSLSSSELSTFDTTMRQAMPPPSAAGNDGSTIDSSSSSSSSSSATQIQEMLQRIAQGYLSVMGGNSGAGGATGAVNLSA